MAKKVLLVPGFSCDADSMLELRAALENSARRYITSAVDFAGDASLDGMVRRVVNCIETDRATLIGLSMGGWVCQAVAARFPEQLSCLVLLSSWSHAPDSYLQIIRQLRDQIAGGTTFSDLRSAVASGFADPNQAQPLADRWLAMAQRVGVEAFLSQADAILAHPHVDEDAQHITIPTLVLAGAADKLIPAESQADDARRIAASSFILIERSGHNLPWEQPDATSKAVLEWLDDRAG
jgi:pimeloyl-ACP methyl ester carboxylesterase